MGRWEETKTLWDKIDDVLIHILNGLPISFAEILGLEKMYQWSIDFFGKEAFYAPHNLWRQPFHAFIGFVFTAPVHWVPYGYLFGFAFGLAKEIQEIYKEKKPLWMWPKCFTDVIGWGLGGMIFKWIS